MSDYRGLVNDVLSMSDEDCMPVLFNCPTVIGDDVLSSDALTVVKVFCVWHASNHPPRVYKTSDNCQRP